jgi:hypothetical protein
MYLVSRKDLVQSCREFERFWRGVSISIHLVVLRDEITTQNFVREVVNADQTL